MTTLSNFLYKISVSLIAILVGIMTLVTLLEVITRNIFGFSITWSGELSIFIFVWVTFIGASAVYKRLEMPAFDMITERLSEKANIFVFKGTQILIIVFSALVIYAGFNESFSPTIALQKSPGLGISMTFPYLGIPIGMSLILIHAIAFFLKKPDSRQEVDS